jgi:hypothetical protein
MLNEHLYLRVGHAEWTPLPQSRPRWMNTFTSRVGHAEWTPVHYQSQRRASFWMHDRGQWTRLTHFSLSTNRSCVSSLFFNVSFVIWSVWSNHYLINMIQSLSDQYDPITIWSIWSNHYLINMIQSLSDQGLSLLHFVLKCVSYLSTVSTLWTD